MTFELFRADLAARPLLFVMSGPVPERRLREWLDAQARRIPEDLIEFWRLFGGGDMFECEELYAPGIDLGYASFEIDAENGGFWQVGLPREYLVVHYGSSSAGASMTAVDTTGALVRLHRETYEPLGMFASVEAWYADLRAAYGFGVAPLS